LEIPDGCARPIARREARRIPAATLRGRPAFVRFFAFTDSSSNNRGARPGSTDPLLIAGLAHLWFVTIHPFDDGNGRIARAIADMAPARFERSNQRFYILSAQIRRERSDYYTMLERTQKGALDITSWQDWFLSCLHRAIEGSQGTLGTVLEKVRFWERFAQQPLNERQIKVLNWLLDGFEGKLTTSKWAKLTNCSQDTAYRDILDLVERGALRKDAGGRSTSHSLVTGVEKK
jgi:Fic family protein